MEELWKRIGDHTVRFRCIGSEAISHIHQMFGDRPAPIETDRQNSFTITIQQGGTRNPGINTTFSRDNRERLRFERPDYLLIISPDYLEADIHFYNFVGLRCVLMNWYSTIIAHFNWGLIVHSSSLVQKGEAHVFAGVSGAGKSTVAQLSHPRMLLADEASLVKLSPGGQVMVYDSPLRSDLLSPSRVNCAPLRAIYMLKQSPVIQKHPLERSKALISIFDKIWYWPYDHEESLKVVRLCRALVEQVPVYKLEFQNNDLFWEEIS
ncbi:hypothetical protein [Cohnella sp.]|uniref:hypothetical protein n=1 Tax=Cohnella sp. TaxID=1883426 RepID=UPI0035645CC4